MAEPSTLARPYAKAAFEAAKASSKLAEWSQSLATLAAVSLEEKVLIALGDPASTAAGKVDLLLQVAPEEGATVKSLLLTMADNNRLALLPEVSEQVEKFRADEEQSVHVSVTSAYKLNKKQEDSLKEKLKSKLGRDVQLETVIDDSIIGGVIIRTDDMVIDGSVTGKLAKLAEAMYS